MTTIIKTYLKFALVNVYFYMTPLTIFVHYHTKGQNTSNNSKNRECKLMTHTRDAVLNGCLSL